MEQCTVHAPFGFPKSDKKSTTQVCRKGYVLEHDNNAKIPVWVSYTLTPFEAVGCLPRVDAFAPDHSLPSHSTPKDYAKSGYDIGHMANDGDMRYDPQTEEDSFILSNMAPQLPGFNRGIWKKLEDYTRGWAVARKNPLLVYVGPIYNRQQDNVIGESMVTVPHGFFKVIVDTKTGDAMAYVFEHKAARGSLDPFMTSIAEVQRQTGVVFPVPKKVNVATEPWPVVFKTVVAQRRNTCAITRK